MALTVTIRSLVLTSVTNLFTENDMNRYFKILATAVAAAGLLASCNREDVTPEQPAGHFIHMLYFNKKG